MRPLQETFDIVALHLLNQGKKSVNSNGFCVYRGPGGLKCAVGVLIPDDKYDPSMEGHGIDRSSVWGDTAGYHLLREVVCEEEGHNHGLASRLQATHDMYPPDRWARAMREAAHLFTLSPAVIDKWEAEHAHSTT